MADELFYDEFSMFRDNADEYGVPWKGEPTVRRETVVVEPSTGRSLSALVWGTSDPEIVLIHGGAQNAHTWDTVALALDRPLVAVDLPGHGHSDHRDDGPFGPRENAVDVAMHRVMISEGEIQLNRPKPADKGLAAKRLRKFGRT